MAIMKQLVLVSTLLLGFSYAYDFSDEFFNQLLVSEYEDIASGDSNPLHPRTRRDDEKSRCHHHHRYKFCCANDLMYDLHEKYRDMKRECYKEVTGKEFGGGPPFTCEELEQRKKDMFCVAECASKKKGVVDDKGALIEEEVMKHVKTAAATLDWFEHKLEETVKKCLEEANAAAEKHKDGCNPAHLKMSYCVFKEIQLACPADQIKDKARCDAMIESIKKHEHPPIH